MSIGSYIHRKIYYSSVSRVEQFLRPELFFEACKHLKSCMRWFVQIERNCKEMFFTKIFGWNLHCTSEYCAPGYRKEVFHSNSHSQDDVTIYAELRQSWQ